MKRLNFKHSAKSCVAATLLMMCFAPSTYAQGGNGAGNRPQSSGETVRETPKFNIGVARDEKFEGERDEAYSSAQSIGERETPRRYLIKKINVLGVESVDPKLLASSAGLNEGDSITLPSSLTSNVVTRLWSQKRFSDIRLGAEFDDDEVTFDIFLKEQPRVLNWAVEGIGKSKSDDVIELLKLKRNSELSDYELQRNKGVIKQYFSDKGYRNVEVDATIRPDTVMDNMVNVTFNVDRKSRVKVLAIDFEGNEAFDDKKLRGTFKKIHQKSINIFKSRKFNEDDYKADKELLIDYYNSKGYRNATVVSDSIYNIGEDGLGINIKVAEGNKFYIRDVTWIGNSKYETDMLQRMFGVNSGDTYDKKTINKRLGRGKEANPDDMSILSLYQNEGYLMSEVVPAEIIVGRDSIDLEIKVFEGRPYTINNVSISGNMRVDDEVIRREVYTRPGDLYNRALVMQTIRTLGNMGHFNAEAIMPSINPVSNSLVDIGWALEEQASDQFNIAGGWGGGSFVGSIGVTLNNLSLGNAFKPNAWRPYPMGKNQKLSISAQSNGTYYKALSASFTDPWVGGKKPNSLTVGVHYSDQNDAYYAWQSPSQYFRSLGASVGLGKRLTWPDPYFSLYGEASYQRYMLQDWSTFVMENGDANLLSLKFVFSRNSVDQSIYPRRGSEFTLSTQVTPPYSAFDNKDYSNSNMSDAERYKFIEFHKWQFKSQWYQSFMKNSNLVLMLKAEMGYLGHYDPFKVSPFERYEVGGDGMSGYNIYGVDVISMRGYEDGALDPIGTDYAVAYNKYTVELRYPVVLEPSSQIYFLGFLEGGNGFSSWRSFSPFNIKRSAGFGVRLYLPVVGMLGIDWGYGFDPAAGETKRSGSQFHFVIGQQF